MTLTPSFFRETLIFGPWGEKMSIWSHFQSSDTTNRVIVLKLQILNQVPKIRHTDSRSNIVSGKKRNFTGIFVVKPGEVSFPHCSLM